MRLLEDALEFWRRLDHRTRLRAGYAVIGLLILALGYSTLAARTAALERKRKAREAVLKELLPLKLSYLAAKGASDALKGRLALVRPDDSPARIVEELGIRGKGLKILPARGEERSGILEDAAEVRVEGLTANEAINLIYRLEKGSRPVLLKKANLRVRFDDPSRLDLSMVVALLKPLPGSAR